MTCEPFWGGRLIITPAAGLDGARKPSRVSVAHIKRSRPYYGIDFKVKVLKLFEGVPSLDAAHRL